MDTNEILNNYDNEVFSGDGTPGFSETTTILSVTKNVSEEDYEYDMEESGMIFWEELLPILIIYCLTFVLGLVGNVLIVFTIARFRKMKSTTNVFLASLASADLLLILFCIPVKRTTLPESSEQDVNLTFEIMMENFDPETGQKLGSEAEHDFEQEGNIRCNIITPEGKSVECINTNFKYNPRTGMMFHGDSPENVYKSNEIKVPISTAFLVSMNDRGAFNRAACQELKVKELYRREDSCRRCRDKDFFIENQEGIIDDLSQELVRVSKTMLHDEQIQKATLRDLKAVSFELASGLKSNGISQNGEKSPDSVSMPSEASLCQWFPPVAETDLERTSCKQKLAKLFSYTWTMGFFLCKFVHYMQSVSAICSVITLTAMSIERYYAIVHPMRAQYICTISQARRIISAIWISAFLLAIPILFTQVHMRVGEKFLAYWCVRDWDNVMAWRAHELYMLFLILVVPTGVMGIAYTAICWEVWAVMKRRQGLTEVTNSVRRKQQTLTRTISSHNNSVRSNCQGEKKRRRRLFLKEFGGDDTPVKQVIKMLVAVVVIYVICWGPMLIFNVVQAYGDRPPWETDLLSKNAATAFHLMAYFNSCINPVIYGFMSKNFRESFQKTLCCSLRREQTPPRTISASRNNTSVKGAESSFGRTISIAQPD